MIDRTHIEKILKLNGLEATSPDDEIKSLLISARWHEDDVETALVVLREDPNHEQHIDSTHRFYSSQSIQPETLHALLGIDVEVKNVSKEHRKTLERAYQSQILSLIIVTLVITGTGLLAFMWVLKAGIFHSQW